MRRHNSATSRSTLTRSKSTAAVRPAIQRLEHIDPVTAERDAHIAATLSFSLAGLAPDPEMRDWVSRNRNRSVHMGSWPEDPADHGRPQSERAPHDFEENGLRRQQSVRFVRQGSRSVRPHSQGNDNSSDAGTIRRRNVLKDVGNRPMSQASDKVERPFVSTYTTKYVASLPPVESFRPPDECAPPPSSYRKLRTSRSMFTSSNQAPTTKYHFDDSQEQSNTQPALRRQSMQDMKENGSVARSVGLRTLKSTSFLRVRDAGGSAQTSSRQRNDLAVQDAEDSFRRDVEDQQYLKPRSSIFFPKTKKSQGSLGPRKSMRQFSSNAHATGSANTQTVSKDASLRRKARNVSNSLKTKLKEIFRRSKKEVLTTAASEPEPADVVQSQEDMETEQDDAYMDIIDPGLTDECSISQVPSRVPSLHNACSAQRLRSRRGSIESIGSERKASDEKSRVTSWTSSGANTLNSQGTWGGERDRQRLSVIKENGPHYSTSSIRRPSLDDHNPYELAPLSSSSLGDPANPGTSVDSDRVYSVLMRRLNEAKQRQQQEDKLRQSRSGDWNLERQGSDHLPKSSNERCIEEAGQQNPSTIKCVLQDDDVFRDSPWDQAEQTVVGIETTNSIKEEATSSTNSMVHHCQQSESGTALASYKAYPRPVTGDGQGSSPPRSSATHNEDVTFAPKTLSTRSSVFFGSPTCHLFRTTSPYRRALQASIKETTPAPTELRSPTASSLNLDIIPTRRRQSLSKEDSRLAYSESIYSDEIRSPRSIPQVKSKPAGPVVPPRHPSHRFTDMGLEKASSTGVYPGAAVKHDSNRTPLLSARRDTLSTPGTQLEPLTYLPTTPIDRTASNASSVEWKTWLSVNASKTDVNLFNARAQNFTEVEYSKSSMPRGLGHVREGAETEEPQSPALYKPACPKAFRLQTPLRTMSHNSRQASSASRVELGTETPVFMTLSGDENAAPWSDERVKKHLCSIYGPPPIPARSSLRTTPSMPLIQSRPSQNNPSIKSADKKASKMRSLDSMPNFQSAEISPRPKSRSSVKLLRRNGFQSSTSSPGLTKACEEQFGPFLTKKQSNGRSPRKKGGSIRRHLSDSSDYAIADRSDATSLHEWKAQTGEGKQMLEDFLSCRRQVPVIGSESTAFL
ncbi:hypothetical protein CT0861_00966 [Colletotrichum tofieldiae]|uniref:Uncharacterized protein n=1 Tax=Colletotrichum tofieldiae TaxID=708197 RepID=A0A166WQG1_9PEZI|nr:hypothetical protein CT0861_00966 [Colletotrichum tofieldiae]